MSTLFKCICSQSKASDVRSLDYRHNGLLEIPGSVFLHERHLEVLHLDSNRISDLPRELFSCVGLRKLTMSENDVQRLPPAIGSLINLEHLDFAKNAIVELPDNVKGLKHLQTLDLSVNPLGRLPDGFTQLLNLTHLFLNDCFMEYLPGSFGRLSKLKVLELRENRLKTLPASVSRLNQLERLDVGNNELQELPAAIGDMSNLAELWCDHNKLRMIPADLGRCRQLMYLDASENQLQWLPAEIEGCAALSDLHLSDNRLQELPETLGRLTSLSTLKVDNNRLKLLPFAIGGLTQLVELNASRNELEELPPTFGLLRNLRTLYADENRIGELPCEIGSCAAITVLSLRSNRISSLPDEMGRMQQLRVLNVAQNRLRCLPLSLTRLKNLQALWLADNQSQPMLTLQTDFDQLTQQKVLTCYLLPQAPSDDPSDAADPGRNSSAAPTASLCRRPTTLAPIDENDGSSHRQHIHFKHAAGHDADAHSDSPARIPKDATDRHARNAQLVNGRGANLSGSAASSHNNSPVHVQPNAFVASPTRSQASYQISHGQLPFQAAYQHQHPQQQQQQQGFQPAYPAAYPPYAQAYQTPFQGPYPQSDRELHPATAMFNERLRSGLESNNDTEADGPRVVGRRDVGPPSVWVRRDAGPPNAGRPPRYVATRGYESDTAALGNAAVPTALLSNAQVRRPPIAAYPCPPPVAISAFPAPNGGPPRRVHANSGYFSDTASVPQPNVSSRAPPPPPPPAAFASRQTAPPLLSDSLTDPGSALSNDPRCKHGRRQRNNQGPPPTNYINMNPIQPFADARSNPERNEAPVMYPYYTYNAPRQSGYSSDSTTRLAPGARPLRPGRNAPVGAYQSQPPELQNAPQNNGFGYGYSYLSLDRNVHPNSAVLPDQLYGAQFDEHSRHMLATSKADAPQPPQRTSVPVSNDQSSRTPLNVKLSPQKTAATSNVPITAPLVVDPPPPAQSAGSSSSSNATQIAFEMDPNATQSSTMLGNGNNNSSTNTNSGQRGCTTERHSSSQLSSSSDSGYSHTTPNGLGTITFPITPGTVSSGNGHTQSATSDDIIPSPPSRSPPPPPDYATDNDLPAPPPDTLEQQLPTAGSGGNAFENRKSFVNGDLLVLPNGVTTPLLPTDLAAPGRDDSLPSSGCSTNETKGQPQVIHVTVVKSPGLGFSIAGGVGSPGNPFRADDSGIFVTRITPEGPAAGRLRVGDKILSVNGIEMLAIAHRDAVAVLKGTVTPAVNLIVERLV